MADKPRALDLGALVEAIRRTAQWEMDWLA